MQHCPLDGTRLQRQTPQQIVDRILLLPDGTRFQVLAPVVRGRKGEYDTLLEDLSGQGFVRARIDGEVVVIDEFLKRDSASPATSSTPSRWSSTASCSARASSGGSPTPSRRRCAWPKASPRSRSWPATASENETMTFSQHLSCPTCGRSYDEPAPRNFSFNSPYGACETCDGLGTTFEIDPELVIPDPDLSINEGAIAPWRSAQTQYFTRMLEAVAEEARHRPRRAVVEAHGQAAEGHPRGHQRARSRSSTRTATAASGSTPRRTRA